MSDNNYDTAMALGKYINASKKALQKGFFLCSSVFIVDLFAIFVSTVVKHTSTLNASGLPTTGPEDNEI